MGRAVRRLSNTANVFHGFIYFVPEAAAEYEKLGLAEFWPQYFGSRAAPMGRVGPEVVLAAFFNFSSEAVSAAIPSVWEATSPDTLQAARFTAAERVLARVGGVLSPGDIAEATDIASAMVDQAPMAGRPLAAANAGVDLPADPITRLWQLVTVIREYRGDGHVAALVSAGVGPVDALALHAGTGLIDRRRMQDTRAWTDAAWDTAADELRGRGLLDSDGALTDAGRAFRESLEDQTDRSMAPMIDVVGDESVHRMCDLIEPLRDALIAEGVYPWRGLK